METYLKLQKTRDHIEKSLIREPWFNHIVVRFDLKKRQLVLRIVIFYRNEEIDKRLPKNLVNDFPVEICVLPRPENLN